MTFNLPLPYQLTCLEKELTQTEIMSENKHLIEAGLLHDIDKLYTLLGNVA